MGNKSSSKDSSAGIEDELRMVMIGKTGSGKSATGNNILRKDAFVSVSSSSSCTRHCRLGQNIYDTEKNKYNFTVVDTPGLFDTGLTNEEVTKEIVKCIGLSCPGPHAILYVVPLAARFTQEEEATALHFSEMFGEKLMDFMVIIFTHGDSMQKEDSIEQRIAGSPQSLRDLVKNCGNRYVVFNNNLLSKDKKKKQLKTFIEVVEKMIETNGKSFYTDDMFRKAEEEIQKQIQLKIEIENMKLEYARHAVRRDVEEGRGVLFLIGKGIYESGKGLVSKALETSGLPRLLNGVSKWFNKTVE